MFSQDEGVYKFVCLVRSIRFLLTEMDGLGESSHQVCNGLCTVYTMSMCVCVWVDPSANCKVVKKSSLHRLP